MHDTDKKRRDVPLSPLLEVKPGRPTSHEALTVFPLLAPSAVDLPYVLLIDALATESVLIGEVGSGSVPNLLASNRGDTDVLILDGEQLIGAKQNRITNRTIILRAKSETVIPVSCMEQGRWHHESEHFRPRPKPRHAPSRVRRKAREAEAAYAAAPSRAGVSVLHAAQGDVWHEISQVSADLGVRSPTGAMDEVYDRHTESLDKWIARFACGEDQVGLLAFLGGRPLGLDVVGSRALYARLHERFLGGYCMDALTRRARSESRHEPPSAGAARRFLSDVGSATRGHAPTVGKGTYHLLSGPAIGAELADVVDHTERLVHLSAFPGHRRAREDARGSGHAGHGATFDPIAAPSRRRGWARGRDTGES
jgi:hypothetical protein